MNYWLMKSEPDVFSIDDLKKKSKQTEPWNGVRNYQARNYMKEMRAGDLAFFYHSSCEIPGIAGLIEITKEAYPDPTAKDPKSDYYEPKSEWFQVNVTFREKSKNIVSLIDLKKHKELKNLIVLRKGNRLSITPVAKNEFEFILKLFGNDR